MINCQVKQDEIDWDTAKLMVNSIYRIWSQLCDQTNNKLLSERNEIEWDIAKLMVISIFLLM